MTASNVSFNEDNEFKFYFVIVNVTRLALVFRLRKLIWKVSFDLSVAIVGIDDADSNESVPSGILDSDGSICKVKTMKLLLRKCNLFLENLVPFK